MQFLHFGLKKVILPDPASFLKSVRHGSVNLQCLKDCIFSRKRPKIFKKFCKIFAGKNGPCFLKNFVQNFSKALPKMGVFWRSLKIKVGDKDSMPLGPKFLIFQKFSTFCRLLRPRGCNLRSRQGRGVILQTWTRFWPKKL